METWAAFWKAACAIGFAAFYLLVLFIIPLGARDLIRLFRHLGRGGSGPTDPPSR
jgi:hypothetical protein